MKNIIGLICARSGSKGIKNKNLIKLSGKNLLSTAIKVGKKSKYIKEIYVSTDSKKIAAEAKKSGAIVPFLRPKNLSKDNTPEFLVWRHAVNYLENVKKLKIDLIVNLPCTAPFRKKEDIDKCIKKSISKNLDVVFTASDSYRNPYFNMIESKNNKISLICKKQKRYFRRQDAPVCYDLNTVCYVLKNKFIKKNSNLFSGKIDFVKIPKARSLDIDEKLDYKIAKLMAKNKSILK